MAEEHHRKLVADLRRIFPDSEVATLWGDEAPLRRREMIEPVALVALMWGALVVMTLQGHDPVFTVIFAVCALACTPLLFRAARRAATESSPRPCHRYPRAAVRRRMLAAARALPEIPGAQWHAEDFSGWLELLLVDETAGQTIICEGAGETRWDVDMAMEDCEHLAYRMAYRMRRIGQDVARFHVATDAFTRPPVDPADPRGERMEVEVVDATQYRIAGMLCPSPGLEHPAQDTAVACWPVFQHGLRQAETAASELEEVRRDEVRQRENDELAERRRAHLDRIRHEWP